MISIVCVYSNERTLREVLLESLQRQTVEFQLITIDNTGNKYRSAAEALNHGGREATGKYLMFVHQDVGLSSDSYLETVETVLDTLPDVGVAGRAGRSEENPDIRVPPGPSLLAPWEVADWVQPGHELGVIQGDHQPTVVQTLDEAILIVPKSVFSRMQFDADTFDGWHCYGADYCLCVRKLGLRAYRLPFPQELLCCHMTAGANTEGLLKYQWRLYQKHRKHHRRIYATTGDISGWTLILATVRQTLRSPSRKIFPRWNTILKRELSGCETLLDLGCGWNSPVGSCGIPFSMGIESHRPYLDLSKRRNIHSQYALADVRSIEFHPRSFDAVVAINPLDRMSEEDGRILIKKMETWARKRVVVVTRNERPCQNGPMGEGKAGWKADELGDLGFRVFGINGLRRLGGPDSADSRILGTTLLHRIIVDLSQKVTYHCPSVAFELLAVKEVCANDIVNGST
jgi:GT2 family glycosyltransferase